MKFGLSPEQYQFILDEIVKPLEERGLEVWCYGSRARGTHHPFSDLDLMVIDPKSKRESVDLGFIVERLSKSNFSFKVDLVDFDGFAESYKESFEKDKVRLSL